jgi:hypothetical protein
MSVTSPGPPFVDIPFVATPQWLQDNAIGVLQNAWPDWEPNEADMETMIIEATAPMAAAVAEQAGQMPAAALRAYGTKVLGIPYNAGSPALTTVKVDVIDDTGWTVPQGAQFEIDAYAFQFIDDAVIPVGDTEITGVPVECTTYTAAANNLTGAVVSPISIPAFVVAITVEAQTSEGSDADDDNAYTNRLVLELRLRGRTLVTAADYVGLALLQPDVGRAVCIGNMAREIEVALADDSGQPVSQDAKDNYTQQVNQDKLINITVTIDDPTYTEVDVDYVIVMYPGYDATDMVTRTNDYLAQLLSPENYGKPTAGQTGVQWINDPTIRPNWLIGQITAHVDGVRYVDSLTIAGGDPDNEGALTLSGTFPLPTPGTMTGSAS